MPILNEKLKLEVQEAEIKFEKNLNYFPPVLKWILIISVLSIIPGYFLTKQISYSLTKNKLKSALITARPSFANPLPLKTEKIQLFNWSQNIYSVMATVENQNIELSAPNVHYKFKFFNAKNSIVVPESGLTEGDINILANKQHQIVLPRITSSPNISRAEIEFSSNISWQRRLSLPSAKIFTTKPSFENSNQPYEFKVFGFVENQSIYELGQVKIILLIKDSAGKIISLSERSEFSLKSGERRSYTQIWPNVNFLNAALVEATAYTDVLDSENLKLPINKIETDPSLNRPNLDD